MKLFLKKASKLQPHDETLQPRRDDKDEDGLKRFSICAKYGLVSCKRIKSGIRDSLIMKRRFKRIWKIIRSLSRTGKIGFFLWFIGFPIGFVGTVLLISGHYTLGTILFFLPWVEGNIGLFLMGKSTYSSIKNEFFGKKPEEGVEEKPL